MTKNYYNYRINGKFAKKPQDQVRCVCDCQCNKQNNNLENHLVLVVDKSGSMQSLSNKVIQFVNSWIDTNTIAASLYNQNTYVTLIEYSTTPKIIFKDINILICSKYINNRCGGMTALFDAQNLAIQTLILKENTLPKNKNVSFMVNHITDGFENVSYIDPRVVTKLMKEMINNGNWTFTFLVPPGNKNLFVNNYGVESGNVQEWEATEQGIFEAVEATSAGLFTYYESRNLGAKSVSNFYSK